MTTHRIGDRLATGSVQSTSRRSEMGSRNGGVGIVGVIVIVVVILWLVGVIHI
jgi:hypothetical protein